MVPVAPWESGFAVLPGPSLHQGMRRHDRCGLRPRKDPEKGCPAGAVLIVAEVNYNCRWTRTRMGSTVPKGVPLWYSQALWFSISRTFGEKSILEMVACLTGRVRGEIVFGEGAVGDAWSACAPSELSESMVLGTASPGWRLNACVPSGLWSPTRASVWDCGVLRVRPFGTVESYCGFRTHCGFRYPERLGGEAFLRWWLV